MSEFLYKLEYYDYDTHDEIEAYLKKNNVSHTEHSHFFYPRGTGVSGVYYFKSPEVAMTLTILMTNTNNE